jgi:hypothetical protein
MMKSALFVLAVFLSRRVNSLDLRLDIAGGTCHNTTEFDYTFDEGVIPGTKEAMDISTLTENEDAIRLYGFSAFRGGDLQEQESAKGSSIQAPPDSEGDFRQRDLKELNCPTFKDCPGSGNREHWCAWICGYWTNPNDYGQGQIPQQNNTNTGGRFLRRVAQDLRIPDEEMSALDTLQPIQYTREDRELWISIEDLVCGWIQRWLDNRLSNCLHGAQLVTCELDLFRR